MKTSMVYTCSFHYHFAGFECHCFTVKVANRALAGGGRKLRELCIDKMIMHCDCASKIFDPIPAYITIYSSNHKIFQFKSKSQKIHFN